MSETDAAVVGIEKCGCVTWADARPEKTTRKEQREFDTTVGEIIRRGGQVKTLTVAEARALANFLPVECPHDPKGWDSDPACATCEGTGQTEWHDGDGWTVVDCADCDGTGWYGGD